MCATRGLSLTVAALVLAVASACGGDGGGASGGPAGEGASGSPSSTGSRFDAENRDVAARWWAGLVKELVEARASNNAIRLEEVRTRIAEQLAPLAGERIRYRFNVWTNRPITAAGVYATVNHRAGPALLRVGAEKDDKGRPAPKGAPLLLRPGAGLEAADLARLSERSTFTLSARIDEARFVDGMWALGFKQYADPPILLLLVSDVAVEEVHP